MARIIGFLGAAKAHPGKEGIAQGFDKAVRFLSSCVDEPLVTETASGLGGRLQVLVLRRKDEVTRVHEDRRTGTLVVCDGSPQLKDRIVSPAEILARYREAGPAQTAAELDGGWMIVIADGTNGEVFIIRDRIGLKPVYYAATSEGLCFASSAGSLIKAGLVAPRLNETVVARYGCSNYRAVYGRPRIFFKDISLLEPATVLTLGDGKSGKTVYWEPDPAEPYLRLDGDEMARLYRENLLDMMGNYLAPRCDGKVAVALSGGIDSGSIAGLMHSVAGQRFDAASLTYQEQTDFDESALIAASVRDNIGRWNNFKLTGAKLASDLPSLYHRFDQPLATVSIYGYDVLYREAARLGYSTFFSGAGGDYIQAGNYTCFLYNLADIKASGDEAAFKREVQAWIRNHGTAKYPKSYETLEDSFTRAIDWQETGRLKPYEIPLSDNPLDPDFLSAAGDLRVGMVPCYGSYLRSYTMQEYRYEAVPPGIEAEDTIDWIYGTEVCAPFFSRAVCELGWRIPPEFKIREGVNKVLARQALRGIVPDEILDRVDKTGFNAPADLWFRGPLKPFLLDVVGSRSFRQRGIFDADAVDRIVGEHLSGRRDHMMLLWQVLNLELWFEAWIDR